MKIILFSFCLMIVSFITNGQDTLFVYGSAPILTKVLEINDTEVKYKKFNFLSGPDYIISKKQITKIIYENGTVELFTAKNKIESVQKTKHDFKKWYTGQNNIEFVASDLLFNSATISFERSFFAGSFSLRVPFSLGLSDTAEVTTGEHLFIEFPTFNQGNYRKGKDFSTGLECFYFPFPKNAIKYFVGVEFEYGKYHYLTPFYTNNPNMPYLYKNDIAEYTGYFAKNGIRANITKHFTISGTVAMGIYKTYEKYYYSYSLADYFQERKIYRQIELALALGLQF